MHQNIALSFAFNQERNEEQLGYEGGVEDVACNMVESYYDDVSEYDDNDNDGHDRR